jgi:hypothetical protein
MSKKRSKKRSRNLGRDRRSVKRRAFKKRTNHGKQSDMKIIDVPLSKKISLGTRATKGKIDFHYQKYANMNTFFSKIHLKNLSRDFFYLDLICLNNKITPLNKRDIKIGNKQFIMFIINVTTNEGNHANIALINNHNKTIEYFEPHGYRKNKNSKIGDFKGIYLKKLKALKDYFKDVLPKYSLTDVVDHKRETSFQTELDPDDNTGFCITWCILFVHYRCLNNKILLSKLVDYLVKNITTTKLLKYAKFVEETVKK